MLSDPAYKQQFQVDLTRMPPTAVGGLFRSCLSVAPVVGKDLKYPLTLIVGFLGEEEAHFVGDLNVSTNCRWWDSLSSDRSIKNLSRRNYEDNSCDLCGGVHQLCSRSRHPGANEAVG